MEYMLKFIRTGYSVRMFCYVEIPREFYEERLNKETHERKRIEQSSSILDTCLRTMDKLLAMKYGIIIRRLMLTVIGAFIASVSINALYLPRNILSGGIAGIAILLNLSFGMNISLVILVLNIPIFIIGYRFISKEFMLYSLVGMGALSFFIQMTTGLNFHSENMLTTILLGGVINGFGFGMILRGNSSTGGNDIISKVLNRKYSYSIASFNFGFNILIIGLSVAVFNLDIAVETLTAMYVSAITANFILEGTNYKRTVSSSQAGKARSHRPSTSVFPEGAPSSRERAPIPETAGTSCMRSSASTR